MKRSVLMRMSGAGLFLFLLMWAFYFTGWSRSFDTAVSEAVKSFQHPFFNEVIIGLTDLNSPPALLIYSLIVAMLLLIRGKRAELLLFLGGIWGTAAVTSLIKELVTRPRPTERLVEISSHSFPSWHSSTSAALALVLWVWSAPRYGRRAYLLFLWPLAIGLSRIWLNAHWCSDVLAGWGLGLAVAGATVLLFQSIQQKREQG